MDSYGLSGEPQTFLFADLAGFTALTEAHGDERAAEIASSSCGRMSEVASDHGSSLVKSIGDAAMLRCPRPPEAVDLALHILEHEHARLDFPGVRVGMNTGSAVERDSDWFGASVNVAARVSATARGGEIIATAATRDASGDPAHVDFQRLGPQRLKNVSEPIELYRVIRKGSMYNALEIDPVCRMTVAGGGGVGVLEHGRLTYRFCSMGCAAQFAADPQKFVD